MLKRDNDAAIGGMFGRIAAFYDLLNRILSLGVDQSWRAALADEARPGPNRLILDIAAGTLDVAVKLAEKWPAARICALDFCMPMLLRGQRKVKGRRIVSCAANAKKLPLGDNCADCVTMAFGIRNITPRGAAFAEMLRVLAPGGKAVVLEFGSGRERIWCGVYNFYLSRALPLIGRAVSRDLAAYEYLARTIGEFPSAGELAGEMRAAGFAETGYRKLTGGIACLHWGVKPR